MMPSHDVETAGFLEEMAIDTEEQYQSSMESLCDQCLVCDMFVFDENIYGWMVHCRMQDVPVSCGGPYNRKNGS